ncbi:VC0807 family protein [Streptomyces winkii]|uniref:VC0807 family protein n=1 Tax=Streptomyces winkii TaxID=3051178 RepID=UPI0028D850CF|nr:VC0807 family protein [Streptomyces sp. DSM 40971]
MSYTQKGSAVSESFGEDRPAQVRGKFNRVLLIGVIAPLALFYGLRWLGVNQFLALLAGAAIPVAEALHGLVVRRRIGGVPLFMLGTMGMSVAMSSVTGSARMLLIRNGWGMAALGVWMLCTLFFRRPFLYEAARVILDEDKQRVWEANWDRHPPFRRLLWTCSAFWGAACLIDASVRVGMAMTLPVDLVPVLDDVLLAVTLVVILLFQRFYGRSYLGRHGLRRQGVRISPLAGGEAARPRAAS